MMRIWKNKLFQGAIFILISASIGVIYSKLNTIEFILKNADVTTLQTLISNDLLLDIKIVKVTSLIIGTILLGLFINHTYKINRSFM